MALTTTKTLYNKYRPQTFDDVVGQDVPVTTMVNAIKNDSAANAYLFAGPRGIGKTTCARIFAKALLCINDDRQQEDGCGECTPCREFDAGVSSDFLEMDAATNRKIDNIRELKASIGLAPVESKRRVVLIDEVHHLTSEAVTALLKILEEPPANVIFLLATTDPQKIPETIRSRCQLLRFRPLSSKQIEERLAYILGAEGKKADSEVLSLIASKSNGGLRDAISMLDMMLTYANDNRLTIDMAEMISGNVSSDIMRRLTGFVVTGEVKECVGFAKRNQKDNNSPREILVSLIDILSLALIIKTCGPDSAVADGASKSMNEMATRFAETWDIYRVKKALDTIERELWKFDVASLNEYHVFNEIIIAVANPELVSNRVELGARDREMLIETLKQTDTITATLKKLLVLEKKNAASVNALNQKQDKQKQQTQQKSNVQLPQQKKQQEDVTEDKQQQQKDDDFIDEPNYSSF